MTTTAVGGTTTGTQLPTRDGSIVGPGGKLGKNEFLKLLTTQLKYQDPMNPQDGQQMATQLAQFTSVEQLQNINDALELSQQQSASVIAATNNTVAINAIGKRVTAPGDQVTVPPTSPEGTVVQASFANAGTAVLKVLDSSGKVVGTRQLGTVAAGLQSFTLGTAAHGLPAGQYKYAIDVTGKDGKTAAATTYMTVPVDGVAYGPEGAVLTSGTLKVPIGTVIKIES